MRGNRSSFPFLRKGWRSCARRARSICGFAAPAPKSRCYVRRSWLLWTVSRNCAGRRPRLTEADLPSSVAMLFERNDALVIEAFRRGEFDYLEGVGEVSETDFFRAIASRKVLQKLADTYPSPCKKHDVPLWVYIAADISMRFHGEHHFHAFPYVVRSGGMITAFGPQMGHKVTHPQTGDVSLRCEGFNDKNEYDR